MTHPHFENALENSSRVYVVQPDEGERIEFFGDSAHFLLTGTQTGGQVLLSRSQDSPGAGPLHHVHEREDELFFIESGCYEFTLGRERVEAGPGACLFAPRGVPHTFRVISQESGQMLSASLPAGLEQFWRLFARECATGAPHMSRITQWGQEFGLSFLTPEAAEQGGVLSTRQAKIVLPPQDESLPHSQERCIFSLAETEGVLSLTEMYVPPNGHFSSQPSRYTDALLLVREGSWEFESEGQLLQAAPGSVVWGLLSPLSLHVTGPNAGRLLQLTFANRSNEKTK